jgi:hypothetical protein
MSDESRGGKADRLLHLHQTPVDNVTPPARADCWQAARVLKPNHGGQGS